jgi:hypothetical protein
MTPLFYKGESKKPCAPHHQRLSSKALRQFLTVDSLSRFTYNSSLIFNRFAAFSGNLRSTVLFESEDTRENQQ